MSGFKRILGRPAGVSGRTARDRRDRASVPQTASPWRRQSRCLAALAGAIALAAGLSIPGVAAATAASAATAPIVIQLENAASVPGPPPSPAPNGECLWAAPWQAYNGGAIYDVPCNPSDPDQHWAVTNATVIGGNLVEQLTNMGTKTCLDADGSTGGGAGEPIFQWSCSENNSDTFQQWTTQISSGVQFQSVGASTCLYAKTTSVYPGVAIVQQTCDLTDTSQLWNTYYISG